ncbi:DUF4817 domain-containing protein [Camponotus japonicus]
MRGWGDKQRGYKTITRLLNENFRNENNSISRSTVIRTIQRFEDTGSIKNRPRSGRRKTATNNDKALDVLQSFVEDPHISINRVAQEHEIGYGSVHKILKLNKWHPYKLYLVQELFEDDFDRRIEFCDLMMEMIVDDPLLLNNIVFSDEATFELTGNVNRHNCRYWTNENPHWKRDNHTQYPQKVNVWAGIFNDRLVGPFFIEGNLTAHVYLVMLREQIVLAVRDIAGGSMDEIYFQQDGAPPHYGIIVRQYLNEVFQDRWIGRRGHIEWPPRSPNLTPLDFFLWDYWKSKVYATKPRDLDDLRGRIIRALELIPLETYRNAVTVVYNRLAYWQAVEGKQYEHLL